MVKDDFDGYEKMEKPVAEKGYSADFGNRGVLGCTLHGTC